MRYQIVISWTVETAGKRWMCRVFVPGRKNAIARHYGTTKQLAVSGAFEKAFERLSQSASTAARRALKHRAACSVPA